MDADFKVHAGNVTVATGRRTPRNKLENPGTPTVLLSLEPKELPGATFALTQSEARAIASALMGAAAEIK